MNRIPIKETINKISAIISNSFSLIEFSDLIEKNEKKHEKASKIETTEVEVSIILISCGLLIWRAVITKRHTPKRVAAVFKICCDVLFAIILGSLRIKIIWDMLLYYRKQSMNNKIP